MGGSITPGWGSAGITSGGMSNFDSAGIAAGLILLKGMTKNPNEGILADHDVMFFGWMPKEKMNKKEADAWFRDSLLNAYSEASRNVEIQAPYEFDYACSKTINNNTYSAYTRVLGGWCELDNVGCYVSISKIVDLHDTIAPEYVGGGESWLMATGVVESVYEGKFPKNKKPEGYEKPAFETLSFYEEVGRHLPDEIFMLIPGQNPYREILYRDGEGSLQSVARPVLVNKGKAHLFVTPRRLRLS